MPKKSKKVAEQFAILPSSDTEWAELSRTKEAQGKVYRKHILNKGVLIHPVTGTKIDIDDAFVSSLKRNFKNQVADIVQVPLANDRNEHSEDPDRNIGEVLDIVEENDKVYAIIDARREDAAGKLGKTWLGASAMLSTNYKDTRTGDRVGPTLLHVAVTNRPYVTGLEDYKEIVAASNTSKNANVAVFESILPNEEEAADNLNDETLQASAPIEEKTMTRDELIAALREEHGIDVAALQAKAAEADTATELSNQLAEQLAETLELSANSVDNETLIGAIAELAQDKVSLSNRVEGLERASAKHVVRGLVEAGFLLPHQEETMVELRLSNPETFEKLIPNEPVVKLSAQVGHEQGASNGDDLDIDAEITRYTGQLGK
jgi:hypothetical protein